MATIPRPRTPYNRGGHYQPDPHYCNHAPDTSHDTQGCPRWPACLAPGTSSRVLHIDPAAVQRTPSLLARLFRRGAS